MGLLQGLPGLHLSIYEVCEPSKPAPAATQGLNTLAFVLHWEAPDHTSLGSFLYRPRVIWTCDIWSRILVQLCKLHPHFSPQPTLCSSHSSHEHLTLLLQGMMLCSPNPLVSPLPSTHAHLLSQGHWQILLLCIAAPLSAEDERLASASQPQSPGSSFVPWALAFTQLWSPLHSHCGSQGRPCLKDARWTEECPCVLNLGWPFPLNANKPFTSVKTLWNVCGFSFLENGLA